MLITYIDGKVSTGWTRGATDTVLLSAREAFPVAPATLSFFNFLSEAPCFPPSSGLF